MGKGRYDRGMVTLYAIPLIERGLNTHQFRAEMRTRYPGISYWMLRQIEADARVVAAYREVMRQERAAE